MAEERIQFPTKRIDSFQVHHADGLWGNWTPEGLVMNFYVDWCKEPGSVVITREGEQYEEERGDEIAIFERVFLTGIRVDISTATAIRDWLSEMIDAMQKSNSDQHKENDD